VKEDLISSSLHLSHERVGVGLKGITRVDNEVRRRLADWPTEGTPLRRWGLTGEENFLRALNHEEIILAGWEPNGKEESNILSKGLEVRGIPR
jgi:hypothetical protein